MRLSNNLKRTKMKFLDSINYYLQGFGFQNVNDLAVSTLHTDKNWNVITVISGILGSVALVVENYIGLTPIVYVAFVVLLALEFLTGVKASLKKGKKIESRKFGRMIVKVGIYTTILGIIHIFKETTADAAIDIYEWIYYVVFNMVVLQLIISVLENLSKLGFAESSIIAKFIKNKLGKWFDVEEPADRD